jgi:hypothetical protein
MKQNKSYTRTLKKNKNKELSKNIKLNLFYWSLALPLIAIITILFQNLLITLYSFYLFFTGFILFLTINLKSNKKKTLEEARLSSIRLQPSYSLPPFLLKIMEDRKNYYDLN